MTGDITRWRVLYVDVDDPATAGSPTLEGVLDVDRGLTLLDASGDGIDYLREVEAGIQIGAVIDLPCYQVRIIAPDVGGSVAARGGDQAKEEKIDGEGKIVPADLDDILTMAQQYSEYLLDCMAKQSAMKIKPEDEEEPVEDQKKGRGTKRKPKSKPQSNDKKAKTAVQAMLTRSREDHSADDGTLTEEEKLGKEQANLVPLLTGGKLKPHQIDGVKWLISLWKNGQNGILADETGLGKTIQTIAFLAYLNGIDPDGGPYMVIAPHSTLSNWDDELSRFVPSLKCLIYHGDEEVRTRLRREFRTKFFGPHFPILITTFDTVISDASSRFFGSYDWNYVVVDEVHRLKHTNSKFVKELKHIPMKNILLLTGTPIQNNLAELWSLLNFILPDIFSSHQKFEPWFHVSGKGDKEETDDENKRVYVASKLRAILRPFLLRRMKEDVEHRLPRKKEIIIYANMTEHQKQNQNQLTKDKPFGNYLHGNTDSDVRKPGKNRRLYYYSQLDQLRKNCAHPDLLKDPHDIKSYYPTVDKLLEQCGKFQLLDRLLDALLKREHKVLIFSQWENVLDLIDRYLDLKGLKFCRIDGSAKLEERRKQIAEFNDLNNSINVFILTTHAGGPGIDLTCADTCILYDSDLNPQRDLQAMDRCHRIGQTRPVHVYRLVTWNSVERRIINIAFSKLKLEHVVIGKGQFQQHATKPNTTLDEGDEQGEEDQDPEEEEDRMIEDLLKVKQLEEDTIIISDEDLLKVMDRGDLTGPPAAADAAPLVPLKGPGWEVVLAWASKSGGGNSETRTKSQLSPEPA